MEDPRWQSHPASHTEYQASENSIPPISRVNVATPAQIDTLPRSTFHSQPPRINTATTPVRRKPVPNSASPSTAPTAGQNFFPGSGQVLAVGDEERQQDARPVRRPQEPLLPSQRAWLQPDTLESPRLELRNLDEFPRGHSPLIPQSPRHNSSFPKLSADQARQALLDLEHPADVTIQDLVRQDYQARRGDIHDPAESTEGESDDERWNANAMLSRFRSKDSRPAQPVRSASHPVVPPPSQTQQTAVNANGKPGVLNSFFGGWKGPAQAQAQAQAQVQAQVPTHHSPKTIPERSYSLNQIPQSPSTRKFSTTRRPTLHAIDVPKANAPLTTTYNNNANHPIPPPTPATSVRIEDMEQELREISTELASSIRREMELEDQIERLQLEVPQTSELSRRTSDYFSDSGTSSVRYPLSEAGGSKTDDVEKLRRRSELEKAQMRLDVSQKLQDERLQKKALEELVLTLEDKVREMEQNQLALAAPAQVHELEASLEDARRKLLEERQLKQSFEDMFTALGGESQSLRSERDRLQDEVVPELQMKLATMEMETSQLRKAASEATRMQQEIKALKAESVQMSAARNFQLSFDAQKSPKFGSIVEDDLLSPTASSPRIGLSRSMSTARGTATAGTMARTGSLSRSGSVSGGTKDRESAQSLADRVKEVERQRDALHVALKSLLDRQRFQEREHTKRVQALEVERDRAQEQHSPRRNKYEAEVKDLRFEINALRKRADEAIEQKWQTEKGLGGLKMDLDRAQQETTSLRQLLSDSDALDPEAHVRRPSQATASRSPPRGPPNALSLEKAYQDLQATQALTLSRLRELRGPDSLGQDADAQTEENLGLLIQTLSSASASARTGGGADADATPDAHLASELQASALSVQTLATQVQTQLSANADLRARLANAVRSGEDAQKKSASRIQGLQVRLRGLEERLVLAQTASEEAVAGREEDVKLMREGERRVLKRRDGGGGGGGVSRSPSGLGLLSLPGGGVGVRGGSGRGTPRSPLSPMFALGGAREVGEKSGGGGGGGGGDKGVGAGGGLNVAERLRMEFLEARVKELERALQEADGEVRELVGKMNAVQIEGAELQFARDEAVARTRALQAQIAAESAKVGGLMRFVGR